MKVIDFFGRSGYGPHIKIDGADLDAYFGADLLGPMAHFNKLFAIGSAEIQKLVSPASDADPNDVKATPVGQFSFEIAVDGVAEDLFGPMAQWGSCEVDERSEGSLAAARTKLAAAVAIAA